MSNNIIFHVIYKYDYENENKNNNLLIYFTLLSIFNVYLDTKFNIHFYYNKLPSHKLWNYIYTKYTKYFILIHINDKINNNINNQINYKTIYINNILLKYGGIYIDNNVILLNKLNINDINQFYIKSKNNEIIYLNKSCDLHLLSKYKYNNNDNYNDNILFNYNYDITKDYNKIINDYSFSDYFHLIHNCSFFVNNINNINRIFNINENTICNLLFKYILAKSFIIYCNIDIINNLFYDNIINKIFNKIIDKIYWINLDKDMKRSENMKQILNKFNIKNERIPAIDGNIENDLKYKYFNYNFDKNNSSDNYPNNTNKEYAILISHLFTLNKLINIDNNINIALILEDDISLDFISYWNNNMDYIINNPELPNDWDIIMLGYYSLNINYTTKTNANEFHKWNNDWSAMAYLVNKNNIKNKYNKMLVVDSNLKWKCDKNDIMVSDYYIFSKFNTFVYNRPYFTFPNNNDSTIHNDHLEYHKLYKLCNYLVLENVFDLFIE